MTIVRRTVDAGQRERSHAEPAAVVSDLLGRPAEARQIPEADLRRPSLETGASEGFADAGATVFAKVGGPDNSEDTLRPKVESAA